MVTVLEVATVVVPTYPVALAATVVVPAAPPTMVTLVELNPAGIVTAALTVAIPAFTVLRFTTTGAVGVAPVTKTAKLADDPGPTRMPAGRTTRSRVVVTTFVAVTPPVKPPEAIPSIVHVPEVVVERTVPYEPSVLLSPVWIIAVPLVREQTLDGEALKTMVMLLGALIAAPDPST